MSTNDPTLSVRQKQCVCKVCGKVFTRPITARNAFCSPECRRQRTADKARSCYLKTIEKRKKSASIRYYANRDSVLEAARLRYANDESFRQQAKDRSTKTKERRKQADPDGYRTSWRDKHLRRTYRITLDEYNELLAKQGGGCAVCGATISIPGTTHSLPVDHNHETGQVRGILCMLCNRGIGSMRDNPDLLIKAAEYLRSTDARQQ